MFGKINTDSIYYVGLQNLFGCPRGGHGAELVHYNKSPQHATPADSGNYTCAPASYRQHSVVVNVIKGEHGTSSILLPFYRDK